MFNMNRYAASLRKRYASILVPPRRLTHSYVRENVTRLGGIKAVIWDIYGTLFGVSLGDLAGSLDCTTELVGTAAATIDISTKTCS